VSDKSPVRLEEQLLDLENRTNRNAHETGRAIEGLKSEAERARIDLGILKRKSLEEESLKEDVLETLRRENARLEIELRRANRTIAVLVRALEDQVENDP
jgi:hypothetical protein